MAWCVAKEEKTANGKRRLALQEKEEGDVINWYPLLAALPPPVLVSYWSHIQIWCAILSWLPKTHPLLCSLLIERILKYDAISSPRCRASSCARFVLKSYSNMILCHLLAALPRPLRCSLLIETLLKYDAMSSHSCITSVCALSESHSHMMRYPLLAALPAPVLVPYCSPIKI